MTNEIFDDVYGFGPTAQRSVARDYKEFGRQGEMVKDGQKDEEVRQALLPNPL
jgi:hypothetical protein